MRAPFVFVAALLLTSLPSALAEYGPESEDGFPIDVDGRVIRPPVIPVPLIALTPETAEAYGLDVADPLNKAGPFTAYPYYPILTAEVQRLARDHPEIVKLTSAGKSVAGLDLWLLEIADFARIEAGEGKPLAEREVVYLDGGHHSNEYSGVYFVTEWAQFLLDEYETNETAKWIVENRHTWILPMVNPDGSNAFGRLNARGVNINRNYPSNWGEVDDSIGMNNPGPSPASEPETRSVIDITTAIKPDYVASIHCCGNLWLFPYGVEKYVAPDEAMLMRTCDEVYPTVREVCGPIWSTIYPASGSSVDTVYEVTGASSWGFEMSGRGAIAPWGQPGIDADVRAQEIESWTGVMHAFLNVHKYGAHPRVVTIDGTASGLDITLINDGWSNLTAGNVTMGATKVAVPFLAPGERATLRIEGNFAAGESSLTLDWQKRVMAAPQGMRSVSFELVSDGGRLVGVLPADDDVLMQASADVPASNVPAPGVALVLLALVGVALRRKK